MDAEVLNWFGPWVDSYGSMLSFTSSKFCYTWKLLKNYVLSWQAYHADQEHFHKTAGKQYWKAVTELVPKELPASLEPKGRQMKEKKEKKSTFVALPGPKPGKPTDMGRFRQVLLKLKHNPPAHMIPPPPPPPKPEAKEGDKSGKIEEVKEGDKGKENAPAAGESPADPSKAAPEAPATPEQTQAELTSGLIAVS